MNDRQPKNTPPERKAPSKVRRMRLHHHFSIGVWMILTNVLVLFFVVYISLSLTESALTAPRWLKEQIQASANSALPQGRLSMGRLAMRVNDRGLPAAQINNLGIFDGRGSEIARLNRVSLRVAPVALFKGQLRPKHLDISGAQISILRQRDGQFALSLGGATGTTGALADLLDGLDSVFGQEVMAEVVDVRANDLTITLQDARTGRIWQITDGALSAVRRGDGLDIIVNFDVFNGTVDLAETEISVRTRFANSEALLGAAFRNAAAADIALQSPALSFLQVVNAPISGSVRTRIGEAGKLESLNAALEIGRGALQPNQATKPIAFDSAKTYLNFDPAEQKLSFSQVSLQTDFFGVVADGHAYLQDFNGQLPRTLVGQFQLSQLRANAPGGADAGFTANAGAADLRVRFDPFQLEFGQIAVSSDQERLFGRAELRAEADGWQGSADLNLDRIGVDRLVALWPPALEPKTRDWIAENVTSGTLSDVVLAARADDKGREDYEIGFAFSRAAIRVLPDWPIVSGAEGYVVLGPDQLTTVLESGRMTAPIGTEIDFAGTSYQVAGISGGDPQAKARIRAEGPGEAMLSLLNLPPIRVLKGTGFAPDFMTAHATARAELGWPAMPDPPQELFRYSATAMLRDAASDRLLPGQTISAAELKLETDNDGITVEGPFEIGDVSGQGRWQASYRPEERGTSQVTGTFEMSEDTVRQFGLGLPAGLISRQALGRFELSLADGAPPHLAIASDLRGAEMRLDEIGWRKPAAESGAFSMVAEFGEIPSVYDMALETRGLAFADGEISFDQAGTFAQAVVPSVRIGNWLRAPVIMSDRGRGLTPAINIPGGTLDMTGDLPPASGDGGDGAPITARLDNVQVTSTIALSGFQGDFSTRGGLNGRFAAAVNNGARVNGQIEQMRNGTGARITSANAGRVLSDAGIFTSADGGTMDLILRPGSGGVLYRGDLAIADTNVRRAPVLTELLSALSIVGLLDQMRGAGIVFSEIQADFELTENQIRIRRSSAVGPSLGISLDGIYDLNRSEMNMQGVISPVYFLNALGQLVSPRRGEGLFGFNYFLTGPKEAPVVQVNPLSILTPGLFRDIFRAPPPQPITE